MTVKPYFVPFPNELLVLDSSNNMITIISQRDSLNMADNMNMDVRKSSFSTYLDDMKLFIKNHNLNFNMHARQYGAEMFYFDMIYQIKNSLHKGCVGHFVTDFQE